MDNTDWNLRTARDCFKLFVKRLSRDGIIIQRADLSESDTAYIDNLQIDQIKYQCKLMYAEYLSQRAHTLPDGDSVSAIYQHTIKHINEVSKDYQNEQIIKLKSQIEDYKYDNDSLLEKIKEYDEYAGQLESYYDQNIDAIHSEIDSLRNSVKTKTLENTELEENIKDIQCDFENANVFIIHLKEANSTLEKMYEKVTTDSEFKTAILENKVADYERTMNALREDVKTKEQENVELNEALVRGRNNRDEISGQIDDLIEMVGTKSIVIDNLMNCVEEKVQKHDELQKDYRDVQEELAFKNSRILSLQAELKTLEDWSNKEIENLNFKIAILERQLADQNSYVNSLNEELDSKNEIFASINEDIGDLEDIVKENESLKNRVERLKVEFVACDAENKELDEQLKFMTNVYNEMMKTQSELNTEISTLKEQIDILTFQLKVHENENEYVERQLRDNAALYDQIYNQMFNRMMDEENCDSDNDGCSFDELEEEQEQIIECHEVIENFVEEN